MGTPKEMFSLRRSLHPTTLERMQGNRNNLHELRKKRDFSLNAAKQKELEILQKAEKSQNHHKESNELTNGATATMKDQ